MAENMSAEKWIRIDIAAEPELTDALANFLTEMGAEGVCQEALLPSDCIEETGESIREGIRYEALAAHFPWESKQTVVDSVETYLDSLSLLFPDSVKPTMTTTDIIASDWGEEWKKYFHPLRVGKRFVIKPTWESCQPVGDDIIIEIDPGMAFGTGQHHSTAMCLEAMEELYSVNASGDVSLGEVLDVGTGTGILGIAAARLGAKNVVCLDIDEQAVAIAIENAELNQVAEKMQIHNLPLDSLRQQFDLILANLTARTLRELSNQLESLLAPGGYLIISGIIDQQGPEIEECFSRAPLCLKRKMKSAEWRCYVITKE